MDLFLTGRSHVGQLRSLNEDTCAWSAAASLEPWCLVENIHAGSCHGRHAALIVADGMGGAMAGEVASAISRETMQQWLQDAWHHLPDQDDALVHYLTDGLQLAHRRIVENATLHREREGMGTTLVTAVIERDKLFAVWSGDSRIYRYIPSRGDGRFGQLQMLTSDHSMVWQMVERGEITPEEARLHPHSNIITQSLGGSDAPPSPDFRVVDLFQGDILLCCTDGLNGMLSDQAMEEIFQSHPDLGDLADALIQAANAAGGRDNITLVLAQVTNGPIRQVAEPVSGEEMPGSDPRETMGGAVWRQRMASTPQKRVPKRRRPGLWLMVAGILIGTIAFLIWRFQTLRYLTMAPASDSLATQLETTGQFGTIEKVDSDLVLERSQMKTFPSRSDELLGTVDERLQALRLTDSLLHALPLPWSKSAKPLIKKFDQLIHELENLRLQLARSGRDTPRWSATFNEFQQRSYRPENEAHELISKAEADQLARKKSEAADFIGPPAPQDSTNPKEKGSHEL